MARYFFNLSGDEQYSQNGSLNYDGQEGNVTGYDPSNSGQGMRRALLFFPTASIRTVLSGLRVTGTYLSFYVTDTYYSASTVVFGTHNYTSIPDIWSASRVVSNRVQRPNTSRGQVNLFSLGTTIGTEFKDGVSTGIALGPAPNNDPIYYVEIAANGDSREPILVIDAEVANVAPNAPTLLSPSANAVINIFDQGANFTWQHNDPDGSPQAGWRFARRRPNGSGGFITEYWNGTDFTTTQTDLPVNSTVGVLTNGALPIPAGKWASGTAWEWAVATKDNGGLWGAYSPWRTLYASKPPVTDITDPGASATTPRPTIRWNFSDPDGQTQYGWAAQVVEPSVYNAPGYSPDNYLGQVWSASANDASTAAVPGVDLRNHRTYRAYVKTASSPNPGGGLQWSPWHFVTFEIAVPPSAPTLDYPLNGSVADLARGFTMQWRNNYYSNTGSQTAYSIRRQVQGSSSYTWWNGSAWVGTEQFLPGSSPSYSFRANEIPNGQTYVFSVAIRDDYNKVSPYSSGASVTGSTAAQVNVIDPVGATNVTNPVITWTTYDVENDPQQTWQMRVIHSSVYQGAGAGFNPLTATAVWDSTERFEENTRSVELPVNLDNGQTYRAYVRAATSGIYSGWAYTEFEVSIVPPALPTATTEVREDEAAIDIIIQGRDSMLSEDASRCFDGWENYDESNSAVTNAVPFGSSQSKYATRVTSTMGGTMTARTSEVWPVAPGYTYTAAASILASLGTTPVNAYISIEFIEAGGTVVAVSSATPTSDETAIRSVTTGVAPPTAAYAGLRITYQLVPDAGAVHQFFDPVLRPTTGSEWTPGGTLNNTYASVSEVTENRKIRYGQGVPIPADTQRVVIRDEEARMGNDMTYAVTVRAVYINAALVTPPVTLPPARWVSGWFWISDPTRRNSGRFFGPKSFEPITRPVRQGKFRPIGRPDAVMTTGVRGLREGSFTIVTHNREEREAFENLSDFSEILLLRIPPDRGDDVGETLYVRFEGDAPEARPLQHRTPHREITQSWVEQRPPTSNFDFVPLEDS